MLARLARPVLDGVFFLDEAEQSPAFTAAVLAHLLRRGAFARVDGGLGCITERLARGVECGVPVLRVEVPEPGRARVVTAREVLETPLCVLAVPAPVARALLAAPLPEEDALLATAYAPAVVVAFARVAPLPRALEGLYGVLFDVPGARVGSLSFPPGGLVLATASAHAAPALLEAADDVVAGALRGALEQHCPALRGVLGRASVQRWRHAIPRSPPGRAQAVARYRRALDPRRPVRLAGDWTSYPTTESAAWSGWAAVEPALGALRAPPARA